MMQNPSTCDEYGESLAGALIVAIDDELGKRNFMTKILMPRCKKGKQVASADENTTILDKSLCDLAIWDTIKPSNAGLEGVQEPHRIGRFADTSPGRDLCRFENRNSGATDWVF